MRVDPAYPAEHDPAPGRAPTSAARAELRTLRERRRRVWRGLALFVVVVIGMVVVSIVNNDEANIRTCRGRLELICQSLQEAADRGQPVPQQLPLPPARDDDRQAQREAAVVRYHVHYDAFGFERAKAGQREAGLACCRWPHTRLIGVSGRHVIVFDTARRRYEVRWLEESAFRRDARRLGLDEALPR